MNGNHFMSKLLDGVDVEWKPLGDVVTVKTGGAVNKQKISDNPGPYAVINSGREPLGFINDWNTENDPIGITSRGAGVGSITWQEGRYFRGNLNYAVTIKPEEKVQVRYLYHLLLQMQSEIQALCTFDGIPALNAGNLKELKIPIPYPENPDRSLQIQAEIVRILDAFTKLTAELTAELSARKKQYNYYRDKLLSFEDCEVEWKRLGAEDIGKFIRGGGLQKKDFTETGVGCIHYGQIYTHYGTYANTTKTCVSEAFAQKAKKAHSGDLVIATTSENDDDVCKAVAWLGSEDIAVSSDACIYRHNLNPKYVSYFFQTEHFQKQKRPFITGTKVRRVNADNLAKILIPVPRMQEQERIVSILDKFDALTNSIADGLPREIKLRQKQYEYYRDMLLSFPKVEEGDT
ncbi:MAG: restriction endonuclease subunit S [Gammaproteobacteria bacterium]|nr:restriction endonuclease subunit S [Gammaproteobacteria bacterium]